MDRVVYGPASSHQVYFLNIAGLFRKDLGLSVNVLLTERKEKNKIEMKLTDRKNCVLTEVVQLG